MVRTAAVLGVVLAVAGLAMMPSGGQTAGGQFAGPSWAASAAESLLRELPARHGKQLRPRLERGLHQVLKFWREEDGDRAEFELFVRANVAVDQPTLDTLFSRFQYLLEKLDGHLGELNREFKVQADLDLGPILPFDEAFAGYDPAAHVTEDLFANKLAFTVLLNFPLTTLDERMRDGAGWSRRQWAEVRLAGRFGRRIPAPVNLAIAAATAEADRYIAEYNIWMHHLVDSRGERLFPAGMRLLSHWNLRDELKAAYEDPATGLAKQRMIQLVMERIVTQTIPAVVVNNPGVDWDPAANTVRSSTVRDEKEVAPIQNPSAAPEPDTRYDVLLKTYRAARLMDPYTPTAPTLIARQFDDNREIPEERVKAMFEEVLRSPLAPEIARRIEKRLGRPLEPFDIWYNGFRARGSITEPELDRIAAKKYPTAGAFQKDIPRILRELGFSPERATSIASNIAVDPARGSGHAMPSGMRDAKVRLRTRVGPSGMDYKGYNIAIHELGHNVEQTISLRDIDYTLLQGVPNTAFTEAIAFLFQAEDLRLLGVATGHEGDDGMGALHDFWQMYEIAGVALVDIAVWHWMYDHPTSTPAELKEATLQIARDVWNKYYAAVFNKRDVVLLAIYSHMIHSYLYLPDYPLGHLIACQIGESVKKSGSIGAEVERMARSGRLTPDLWMRQATGSAVGTDALLNATEVALASLRGR